MDVLRVGTLSKTLGSLGGFVAGPSRFVELLVNRARPYIFTTAPHPGRRGRRVWPQWPSCAPRRVTAPRPGWPDWWTRVAGAVGAAGHSSPIVPVVIGDEDEAVAASAALSARGLWVPAIRPPTVPAGTSRPPGDPVRRPHR